MSEPVFGAETRWLLEDRGNTPEARDAALVYRATTLAIESAFRFGIDLPVGAVVSRRDRIVGKWFASDQMTGFSSMHAEKRAILDNESDPLAPDPDTLAVSLEPCGMCQDFIRTKPSIERVVFGVSREDAAERGLLRPHETTIFDRVNLPYEVVQVEDEALRTAGLTVLDHVTRDIDTGIVTVDTAGLSLSISALNAAY